MKLIFTVLLILVSHAFCDTCTTYTFEEGYPDSFNNNSGWCSSGMAFWDLGRYNDTTVTGHNTHSTKFMSPVSQHSCVSSFLFPMERGGTVEVNMFMETSSAADIIEVMVMSWDESGITITVGTAFNSPFNPSTFVRGWHTMKVNVGGNGAFRGFISFIGYKQPAAIVLVDSFRYLPPGMDESECPIYPEPTMPTESTLASETTTAITTESTTKWTTEVTVEPTTTEASTITTEGSTEVTVEPTTTEASTTTTDGNTEVTVEPTTTEASTTTTKGNTEVTVEPTTTEASTTTTEGNTEVTVEPTTSEVSTTTTEGSTEVTVETTTTEAATITTEGNTDGNVEPTTTKASTLTTEQTTSPPTSDDSDDTLWTPLRLTLLASLLILIIVILCCFCYCRRSKPAVVILKA